MMGQQMRYNLEDTQKMFELMDKQKKGSISINDFLDGLKDEINDDEIEPLTIMFNIADKNNDGELNSSEFFEMFRIMSDLEEGDEQSIYTALFKMLDTDGNGSLTSEEIKRFYSVLGYQDDLEINSLLTEFDLKGDGTMGLQDFLCIMN